MSLPSASLLPSLPTPTTTTTRVKSDIRLTSCCMICSCVRLRKLLSPSMRGYVNMNSSSRFMSIGSPLEICSARVRVGGCGSGSGSGSSGSGGSGSGEWVWVVDRGCIKAGHGPRGAWRGAGREKEGGWGGWGGRVGERKRERGRLSWETTSVVSGCNPPTT